MDQNHQTDNSEPCRGFKSPPDGFVSFDVQLYKWKELNSYSL